LEFMRSRVKKVIQKYRLITPYERVAVALSGGKDSAVLFHILDAIYSETLDLLGLHINLGIEAQDYSLHSQRRVKDLCDMVGREMVCVDLQKEYQLTMDLIQPRAKLIGRSPCGICGVFKRYLLNRYSMQLDCEKLATGHVLDDEVSVLLINLFNGNIDQLIRTGPYLPGSELMVTRIKPLYEISEIETEAYASASNLATQEGACPYSTGAPSLRYKAFLQNFEQTSPGLSNIFLQNFLKKVQPALQATSPSPTHLVKACRECHAPTSEEICSFCNIRKALMGTL
jgi:uncharacterized protein (TIGR00269 family)